MYPFKVSVGVLVVVFSALGCESAVSGKDPGPDTSSGQGGGGGGGTGGAGEGGSGSSTTTGGPTNSPDCPGVFPGVQQDCAIDGLSCSYPDEDGCTVAYTCVLQEDCGGGFGGYGDCPPPRLLWAAVSSSCFPDAVECEVAERGQSCAFPGDGCSIGLDECASEVKQCNDNHSWDTDFAQDPCCQGAC